ncbi:nucleotidyltransferase family protein [Methylocystis sp. JAN1]|uniref:nucleotidyltransferase family protein n=1 Tax=Methylocystis sp. JAN1 TaxID=3397211 RepID=UPI003FA1E984
MVFAAGLGTRMRPLTHTTPKPLVSVAGRTLIDYALDDFARAGVDTAIVNVHHLADEIEAHLASRREPRIVISDERAQLLDQGGGIKKVLPLIGDAPFFICNTDAFWFGAPRSNLLALAQAWDAEKMDAALLLSPTQGSVGVDWEGDFDLSPEGRIVRRAGPKPYVYSGVGLIKPQLFAQETQDVFKLAPFFFSAAEKGRLFGVVSSGLWLHVGTAAAIEEAEKAIAALGE